MSDFSVKDDGIGWFPELSEELGVGNIVTYNNKKWGNMNEFYARNENEKERIQQNDQKIAKLLGAEFACSLTTPPEDTFIDFSKESLEYLRLVTPADDENKDGVRFVPIRANAMIVTERKVEVVAAPADCAIVVLRQKEWEGMIVMHIGSPQVVQQLYMKVLTYFSAAYPGVDVSAFEVFIFPHICGLHYPLKEKKAKRFEEMHPELADFYLETKSGDDYGFDFMGYVTSYMKDEWGIGNFHDSGMCTWEEAKKGNLFSYELASQAEEDEGEEFVEKKGWKGCFNVAVSLK